MWIAGLCLVWLCSVDSGLYTQQRFCRAPFPLPQCSWIDTSEKRVIVQMDLLFQRWLLLLCPPYSGLAEPTQDLGFPTESSVPFLDYDGNSGCSVVLLWCSVVLLCCSVLFCAAADFSCCGWGQTSACRERICQGLAMSPLLPPCSHRTGTRGSKHCSCERVGSMVCVLPSGACSCWCP